MQRTFKIQSFLISTLTLVTLLSLPGLRTFAQTNPHTGHESHHPMSMSPEEMQQHHQQMMEQMQSMMENMEQCMAQMTPEQAEAMKEHHQQMMTQMQTMMNHLEHMNYQPAQ